MRTIGVVGFRTGAGEEHVAELPGGASCDQLGRQLTAGILVVLKKLL
jgi:hypothetical protein